MKHTAKPLPRHPRLLLRMDFLSQKGISSAASKELFRIPNQGHPAFLQRW
jgi:hypothetical protein